LSVVDGVLDGANGSDSVVQLLRQAQQELRSIEGFSNQLKELSERLHSSLIELEDLRGECARVANGIEYDPQRLEVLREKMDLVQRLMHKHGVQTIAELLDVKEEYRLKLEGIASYEDELAEVEGKLSEAQKQLKERGKALTDSRKSASEAYVARLTEQVRILGMPKATIDLRIQALESAGSLGMESVEMWFDANGSSHLVPLKDSASGGEVSRLMLALKRILAENDKTPTLIFDEIDTGVSGEIAKQIGSLMRSISGHTQIIAVTHLPGVAAKGEKHLRIAKREEGNEVLSELRILQPEERVEEIAGMFSGHKLNEASLQSARNLLEEQ